MAESTHFSSMSIRYRSNHPLLKIHCIRNYSSGKTCDEKVLEDKISCQEQKKVQSNNYMFALSKFLVFLLYGPYQPLLIWIILFIYLLYLYLGIFNFLMSKAILTYNQKVGLLIDFKTEWTITKVMGLYPTDWKPQKVIPEMDDFMLRMIYDHSTFYYFIFFSLLITLCFFILFICKESLSEKVYETENPLIIFLKNKKSVLLIYAVLVVLCFFLWLGRPNKPPPYS